ncbi:hypothetical protein GCM10011316_23400 [Roseibium aquae]|uniref:diguanylate cyclase n=1 Tax=Roseibium aquae TaxID=1323746 RepID=A0A916TLE9_9HYPH|nr:sensor domain-containing diguanylate cyclase [Roseibium aquae]GGB50590.1 hypothetical protein GCM10011316_23400 [Roseibium aquae]
MGSTYLRQQTRLSSTEPSIDFRALTEACPDAVIQLCPQRRPIYASPAITTMTGWDPDELTVGKTGFFHAEDITAVHASFDLAEGQPAGSERAVFRIITRTGTAIWVEAMIARIAAATGLFHGFVMTLRDISDRLHYEAQLEILARQDSLTGLANRREFDLAFEREWAVARRERQPLSLVLADLDRFKLLNDRYGHSAGDTCLKAVAGILKEAARRPADIAARLGGEEFVLLLPRTHEAGARTVGEQIRKAIEDLRIENADAKDHGGILTVSVGVVTAISVDGPSSITPARIIEAADRALYTGKQSGRNRVCFSRLTEKDCPGLANASLAAN